LSSLNKDFKTYSIFQFKVLVQSRGVIAVRGSDTSAFFREAESEKVRQSDQALACVAWGRRLTKST